MVIHTSLLHFDSVHEDDIRKSGALGYLNEATKQSLGVDETWSSNPWSINYDEGPPFTGCGTSKSVCLIARSFFAIGYELECLLLEPVPYTHDKLQWRRVGKVRSCLIEEKDLPSIANYPKSAIELV
jgi:hypothetical protein